MTPDKRVIYMSEETLRKRVVAALFRNRFRILTVITITLIALGLVSGILIYRDYQHASALEFRYNNARSPRTWGQGTIPASRLKWSLVTRLSYNTLEYRLQLEGQSDHLLQANSQISQVVRNNAERSMFRVEDSPETSPIVIRFVDSAGFTTREIAVSSFTRILDASGTLTSLIAEGKAAPFDLEVYEQAASCVLTTRF